MKSWRRGCWKVRMEEEEEGEAVMVDEAEAAAAEKNMKDG